MMVAAYNAGEPQAQLWRSYCYSFEPAEYLSKVGFPQTRGLPGEGALQPGAVRGALRRAGELKMSRPRL